MLSALPPLTQHFKEEDPFSDETFQSLLDPSSPPSSNDFSSPFDQLDFEDLSLPSLPSLPFLPSSSSSVDPSLAPPAPSSSSQLDPNSFFETPLLHDQQQPQLLSYPEEGTDGQLTLEQLLEGISGTGPFVGAFGEEDVVMETSCSSADELHISPSSPSPLSFPNTPISSSKMAAPSFPLLLSPPSSSSASGLKHRQSLKAKVPTVPSVKGLSAVKKASSFSPSSSSSSSSKSSTSPSSSSCSSATSYATLAAPSSPPTSPPSSPDSLSSRSRSPSPLPSSGHCQNPLSTKPTTFQIGKAITLELSEEELVNMEMDQLARLAGTKFTKSEEKELKRLRRKARNKVSAAQSRQKKRDYVSGLEERVEAVSSLNVDLKKRLKELERDNLLLKSQVEFLSTQVAASPLDPAAVAAAAAPDADASTLLSRHYLKGQQQQQQQQGGLKDSIRSTGVYLMLIFLSFGIFFNVPTFNGTEPLPATTSSGATAGPQVHQEPAEFLKQVIFNSASPPSSSAAAFGTKKSFIFRRMHVYDDSYLMDTLPMVEHQSSNGSDEHAFWDSYYEAELKNIDFNERYDSCASQWSQDSQTMMTPIKVEDLSGIESELNLEEGIRQMKLDFEKDERVEKVVCTTEICLVRLENTETLV